jgi:hypothetical protein
MCAAQKCQPDSRAPMFAAADKCLQVRDAHGALLRCPERPRQGDCDCPPSAPRFACLVGFAYKTAVGFAFKTAVYLTLLPGHQAAFYAEDKVAAKARLHDAPLFSRHSHSAAQAKFFESDAPYFIGQLSKARTSPHCCFASFFVASFLIFLSLPHTSRSRPSFPPARQRKWRPLHLRDHRG